jgi:hypothetical protein
MPLMQTTNTYSEREKANVSTRSGNKYDTTVDKTNYIEAFITLNIVWKFVTRTKIKQFSENVQDTNLYINVHIPKDTEFILKYSGISNPFSLKDDDILMIPNEEEAEARTAEGQTMNDNKAVEAQIRNMFKFVNQDYKKDKTPYENLKKKEIKSAV